MKSNFKKYLVMVLAVCFVICLACLSACKDNGTETPTTSPDPAVVTTTPETTTPKQTTPQQTTPPGPVETVTFPSEEDSDPKKEDSFID